CIFLLSGFRPISIQLHSATQEAALHLPALGLSPYLGPAPQCMREAAMHLPALGLSPYQKQGKSSFVCKQPIWIFLVFGTAQCLRTLYHTGGIF
ncbi:hypothetical protein, partial [Roseburia sp. OM04-10AA]|uniref:hypothetical protein n=1 Tax=Roseburia sp. OM04-10AA TaxID=2293141 RepID=UPI001A9B9711